MGETDQKHEAARAKFRARLSQELRRPLNTITGFAELLAMRPQGVITEDGVLRILQAAKDLLSIIHKELGEAERDFAPGQMVPRPPGTCDVLYIEDDFNNFTLVERILKLRPSLKLLHATRGEIGLNLARLHRPNLVLLDLHLPDMQGAEVLQQLQQNVDLATIPVVVLSADATPSQIECLLKAGARNYLTKPIDVQTFLTVVDDIFPEKESPVEGPSRM